MAQRYLGQPFDIHTGGVDHIAVHHTNEVAQSECAWDVHPWVGFWMHNEFLDLRGEKMAKSTGNVAVLDDLLARGLPPLAFRYFFLQAHYRQQQTYTDEAMDAAATGYERLLRRVRRAARARPASRAPPARSGSRCAERFRAALRDDLNAPRALAVAWEATRAPSLAAAERWAVLREADAVLGPGSRARRAARPRARRATRASTRASPSATRRASGATSRRPTASAASSPPRASRSRTRPAAAAGGAHESARQPAEPGQAPGARARRGEAPSAARPRARGAAARFQLVSEFEPKGDQPRAIEELVAGSSAAIRTRRCSASPAAGSRSRSPAWSSR